MARPAKLLRFPEAPLAKCAPGTASGTKRTWPSFRAWPMTPVVSSARCELSECNRQHDDRERDNDDPKQIAVGNASRGKIRLRLPRTLCEFGEVFIAQLANRLVHLLVIEFGGLQRFLALIGRKQCPYSFFVSLAGLRRTSRVFAQIAQRNDVLLVLRPCRGSHRHEQSGQP